jgi:hypothetical protein
MDIQEINELWADRAHRDEARKQAKEYVAEHPDMAESFADLSIDAFVRYVDQARADGDEDAVARANVWAMAQPPIEITGSGRVG